MKETFNDSDKTIALDHSSSEVQRETPSSLLTTKQLARYQILGFPRPDVYDESEWDRAFGIGDKPIGPYLEEATTESHLECNESDLIERKRLKQIEEAHVRDLMRVGDPSRILPRSCSLAELSAAQKRRDRDKH